MMSRSGFLRRWGVILGLLAAFVILAEASCRTAPARRGPRVQIDLTQLDRWVAPPSIRVGIGVETPRVSIAADSGVILWDAAEPNSGPPRAGVQRATFVCVRSGAADRGTWRVQLASLADEGAAHELARRVEAALGLVALDRWNATTRTHQVRAGGWPSREEAQASLPRLARAGFGQGFVVDDASATTGRVRALETGDEFRSVLILPAEAGEDLTVDGAPYRGLIEVRSEGAAGLTVVNLVNLEDYVRGVVPNELSPRAYPQIEALKAQAVAARTYALRNRGQFSARGFDICASPACQVYKGRGSEQSLSDEAVAATRGVVATYNGELINAFYTSTCGGHTENAENIFEGSPVPYLRGVSCAAEGGAWRTIRTPAPLQALGTGGGSPRDAALLVALGIVDPREPALAERPSDADVERWTTRLLAALSRTGCALNAESSLTRRGGFFSQLVGRLCWEDRARRLMLLDDLAFLLQIEDRSDFADERERLAAGLLIQEKLITADANNTLRPGEPITRAQAMALLAEVVLRVGAPRLVTGELKDVAGGRVTLRVDGAERAYALDPAVRLFRSMDGAVSQTREILMAPGDTVRLVEREGRAVFLQGQQTSAGVAADRGSRYYRWEVSLTPAEVARGILKHGTVGTVRDIVPRRFGVSGRVVELAVLGSDGELVLKGLAIRWALGLRENLFAIDREVDRSGAVQRFVFNGKGWGHGVGLCQVGAAGLAEAGQTYDTILKHYYTGIVIEKRD
jgi:stage II sporulation protein D